jgi:hypothetical protein
MIKLKIIRANGYFGMIRKLGIFIDGQKVGDVGNGSEVIIDVPNGAVFLEGRMDWGKTTSVAIDFLLVQSVARTWAGKAAVQSNGKLRRV